jgi:hypothetical protein
MVSAFQPPLQITHGRFDRQMFVSSDRCSVNRQSVVGMKTWATVGQEVGVVVDTDVSTVGRGRQSWLFPNLRSRHRKSAC